MLLAQKVDVTAEDLLVGKEVRVWPLAKGFLPRDIMWTLWKHVEEDGDLERLLYGSFALPRPNYTLNDPRGSLEDFIQTVGNPANMVVVAQSLVDEDFLGFGWFNEIVYGLRANMNGFVRTCYRQTSASMEFGWIACRYMFEAFDLRTIWTATPWEAAAKYSERLGFEPFAELPDFNRVNDEIHPMRILRLTRKRFSNGSKPS